MLHARIFHCFLQLRLLLRLSSAARCQISSIFHESVRPKGLVKQVQGMTSNKTRRSSLKPAKKAKLESPGPTPRRDSNTTTTGDDDDDNEEDPDVEELKKDEICRDNHASCVNGNIDAVLEVFDETTCLDMLRSYYEIYSM